MGYSCSAKANYVMDQIAATLRGLSNTSNEIVRNGGFWEIGRENYDGAITGTVWKKVDETHVRRAGTFRIEADGTINRFPTLTKWEKTNCEKVGLEKYKQVYETPRQPKYTFEVV